MADAINAYNLALPTGVARIDTQQYPVSLNNTPPTAAAFNDIPIKYVNGTTVYLRDVAQVRDGYSPQTTVVRRDGHRGALVTILKNGAASTLEIVQRVKELLPTIQAVAPKDLKIELLFDQSLFVEAAVSGVVQESIIAGPADRHHDPDLPGQLAEHADRRGLDPAVDPVLADRPVPAGPHAERDDAGRPVAGGRASWSTTPRWRSRTSTGTGRLGKPLKRAILDGAQQIAVPTFVSTLTICAVFVSVVFLEGPPRYLFVPLALAVVFAMLASYVLSRTLVPVMADYLLPAEEPARSPAPASACAGPDAGAAVRTGALVRPLPSRASNAGSSACAPPTCACWTGTCTTAARCFAVFLLVVASGFVLLPYVGRDFFPVVDAGQFRLHVRAPAGTRLEQTAQYFNQVEAGDPPGDSGGRDRDGPGQHRPAQPQLQHGLRRQRHHGHGRRRDPGGPEARTAAARRPSTSPSCGGSCRSVSRN